MLIVELHLHARLVFEAGVYALLLVGAQRLFAETVDAFLKAEIDYIESGLFVKYRHL